MAHDPYHVAKRASKGEGKQRTSPWYIIGRSNDTFDRDCSSGHYLGIQDDVNYHVFECMRHSLEI